MRKGLAALLTTAVVGYGVWTAWDHIDWQQADVPVAYERTKSDREVFDDLCRKLDERISSPGEWQQMSIDSRLRVMSVTAERYQCILDFCKSTGKTYEWNSSHEEEKLFATTRKLVDAKLDRVYSTFLMEYKYTMNRIPSKDREGAKASFSRSASGELCATVRFLEDKFGYNKKVCQMIVDRVRQKVQYKEWKEIMSESDRAPVLERLDAWERRIEY